MYEQESCVNCSQFFAPNNLPRIIPTCDHNICTVCLKKSFSSHSKVLKCQNCQSLTPLESEEIQAFPKDITLIKHLRQSSISASSSSKKLSEDTQILSGEVLPPINKSELNVKKCSLHEKSLDIICITDKKLLCAHCAIFGEHRDHKFKTIDEFCRQIQEKKSLLRKIQNRKGISDESIKSEYYRRGIASQLSKKKSDLHNDIKENFSKLKQLVQNLEEKVMSEVDKVMGRVQFEVKRLIKEQGEIEKMYNNWKQKSYSYFTGIEKETELLQKISIFYNPGKGNLTQGEIYVKQIEQKNHNTKETINSMINGVTMEFSHSIQTYLTNYARLRQNPSNLTTRNIQIISREKKSPEERKEEVRRPPKVQFVKSDAFQQEQNSLQKKQRSKQKEIPSKNQFFSPMSKIRPNSRGQKQKLEKKVSPYKKMIPMKAGKRLDSGTPIKFKTNLEFADRMLAQFRKSTDTLDLSNCDLQDQSIVQIVQAASQIKKIKCLKLTKNKLTNEGLKVILSFLSYSTSLNLSYNLLSDECLDEFIRRKDNLYQLRIMNLSHNKINDRKVKNKLEELKRIGIIVTL